MCRTGAAVLGLAALALACACPAATVTLGDEGCARVETRAETIDRDGFEQALPTDPSLGSGGATGDLTLVIDLAGWPSSEIYLHVPPSYTPARTWPVVLALHGASGSHALAVQATTQLRTEWAALADQYGFIVIAPVGVGALGSWFQATSPDDQPSDYDWGFSAGGHVMHDLVVRGFTPALDAGHIAAYGVDAGVLQALACASLSAPQCGAQRLAPMTRRVPLAIEIGKSDSLLSYARADRLQLLAKGWVQDDTLHYREFQGGHQYSSTELADVWSHLCHFGVTP
jgi:hypothetical protein